MESNETIVGYDLDGVLCINPPEPPKPYRHMNGAERQEYKAIKEKHYKETAPLFAPPGNFLHIITARSEKYRDMTKEWLDKNLVGKEAVLHCFTGRKNYDNVSKWKSEVIIAQSIKTYVEDNKTVLKKIKKNLENAGYECRLNLFAEGRVQQF